MNPIVHQVNQYDRTIKDGESRNIDSQHRLSIFFRETSLSTLLRTIQFALVNCYAIQTGVPWDKPGITFQSIAPVAPVYPPAENRFSNREFPNEN